MQCSAQHTLFVSSEEVDKVNGGFEVDSKSFIVISVVFEDAFVDDVVSVGTVTLDIVIMYVFL